jgi:hypothetical protein
MEVNRQIHLPTALHTENNPGTCWTGGWVGSRADLDFSRNKIRFPLAAFEHGTVHPQPSHCTLHYRGADKSLALPWRKQATATEDFDVIYPIYWGLG